MMLLLPQSCLAVLAVAVVVLQATPTACASSWSWRQLPAAALTRTRRFLNLSNTLGSATRNKATPYDRITGHPVFSVTTPWGSPYMNMEKLDDMDSSSGPQQQSSQTQPQSVSEEQSEVRTVALYCMDPDDALAVHAEMKQLEQMEQTDIRITSCSLGKAIRQASNTGGGLPTGQPPNPLTGQLDPSQGAMLRYKIVPPKRQLFYAARCIGKERVGLFGETPAADAQMVVMGNSAVESENLRRRREKRERTFVTKKMEKPKTPMQAANEHMEGYTGIPVFYCPAMQKKLSPMKRLLTGTAVQIPLFFNYEDLQQAWSEVRQRHRRLAIPEEPESVEVFNLWDLLTSMDKDAWNQQRRQQQTPLWQRHELLLEPLQRRFGKTSSGLQDITFIPSSRSVQYKEAITARGNGKARLRPMRKF